MSQRTRVVTAALVLSAALLLALPAPSRASSLWHERIPTLGWVERFWSWMTSLRPAGASSRRTAPWEKEGSVIDPMGQPRPQSMPPPQGNLDGAR
jgi:hypothetical protein